MILMFYLIRELPILLHHVPLLKELDQATDRIEQTFRTTLPSGEVLLSDYWLRHMPIIIFGRELYVDLIILEIVDYDFIL